ncbi:Nuclear pore complex protein NUP214 [Linum grandiflorum]
MAVSAAEASSEVRVIQLEEEEDGPQITNNDYFFDKIGMPIPILKQSSPPPFDLTNPPSRPLAVSEAHRLIFLAHSSGFCVARTKDVIDAAVQMTGTSNSDSPCVQQLSFVDVPIANVCILSLSADSSTLAVAAGGQLHFFTVASLLNKDVEPSVSCSLDGSSTIKDVQWKTKSGSSCLVLSSDCKLHHAAPDAPLKHVMDNVDAVSWSMKGKSIAVARENRLIILSTKFKERLSISLPFNSWTDDSDDDSIVKVDCIKWVRLDSIIIGCFKRNADGKEDSYLLQVIRSKGGKITDAASEFVVLSFYDLFTGLIDDIVPFGSGPYLFFSYLEQSGVAIVANRKNTDEHIMLFGWSVGDEEAEIAVLEIDRDTWRPRINLQADGDDNLIMGLSVDKVSIYGNIKVDVGLDDYKELPPLCVLICVTRDGKLVMFHVASRTGNTVPPEAVHDEEDDVPFGLLDGRDDHNLSCALREQSAVQLALGSQLEGSVEPASGNSIVSGIPSTKDLKPSDTDEGSTEVVPEKNPDKNNMGIYVPKHEFSANEQPRVHVPELQQGIDGQQLLPFGQQNTNFNQSSFRTNVSGGPGNRTVEVETSKAQTSSAFGTHTTSFSAKASQIPPSQPVSTGVHNFIQPAKETPASGSSFSWGFSSQLQSSGRIFPEKSESKASLSHSATNKQFGSSVAGNFVKNHTEKLVHLPDASGQLASVIPTKPVQIGGFGASSGIGKLESLPTIRSPQLSFQDGSALGSSLNQRPYAPKERVQSLSNAVPNMTRQFGSIQETVKELDILLEGIQEKGGFRDACTVSLRSSIEALETGIGALSRNCGNLKGMMDKRLEEIQDLLDKTIQVLARKTYMEGIVRQTSDNKYWELWDRQKLSPELELKRQHILELNQGLMNKLVELERHLNTLELNQFGENDGNAGRLSVHNKYGMSRHMQSIHSLCNTTNSQIAAAEQLSDCLSKQMALLRVQSPVKQKNIKKELFETIGIPYDASFSSPQADKGDHGSPFRRPIMSGSNTSKQQSRRRQSGALKASEPESSRRRRDSLDQNWTSFEPSKTTVKRMELQGNNESKVKISSMPMAKQRFGPHSRHGQDIPPVEDNVSIAWQSSGNKGTLYPLPEQVSRQKPTPFNWVSNPPMTLQGTGSGSAVLRVSSTTPVSGGSVSSPIVAPNWAKEIHSTPRNEESGRAFGFEKLGSPLIGQPKLDQRYANVQNKSAPTTRSPSGLFSLQKPVEVRNSQSNLATSPAVPDMKPGPESERRSPFGSVAVSAPNTLGVTAPPTVSSSQTTDLSNIPSMSSVTSSNTATSSAKALEPAMSGSRAIPDSRSSLSMSSVTSSNTATSSAKALEPAMSGSRAIPDSRSSLFQSAAFAAPSIPGTSQISFGTSKTQPGDKVQPLGFSIQSPVSSSQTTSQSDVQSVPSVTSSMSSSMAIHNGIQKAFSGSATIAPPTVSSVGSLSFSPAKMQGSFSESPAKMLQGLKETASSLNVPQPTSVPPQTEVQPAGHVAASSSTQIQLEAAPEKSSVPMLKLGTTGDKDKPSSDKSLTSIDSTASAHESSTVEIPRPADKSGTKPDVIAATTVQNVPSSKSEPAASYVPTTEAAVSLTSANLSPFGKISSSASSAPPRTEVPQVPQAQSLFQPPSFPNSSSATKNEGLDVGGEDEMDEEAPETSKTSELSLGSLGGFGLGSTPNPGVPRGNPFGSPFGSAGTNSASSSFSMSVPSGELFRPASFSFQSPQPSQPPQSPNVGGVFSGGFGSGTVAQVPAQQSTFGQPAQVGGGQQALGSVLGSFGQSRQLGPGLPGSGFGAAAGGNAGAFGGFANSSPPAGGGFANVATGGGFASMAKSGSGGGGFGGLGSAGGGGFGAAAASGGGFGAAAASGGGFGAAAASGGGFGAAASGGGFGAAASGGGFGAAASGGGFGAAAGGGGFGGGFGGVAASGELCFCIIRC